MATFKNVFGVLRSKGVALKSCVAAGLLLPSLAMAQTGGLPSWASSMISDMESSATALIAAIVSVVAIVLVAQVVIRLTKRFSKAI